MNWIILCGIVIIILIIVVIVIVIINEIQRRCQIVLIMRDLWSNNVYWIREYMIREYEEMTKSRETEGLQKIVNRLTKNQEDLGTVFGYFYGRQIGQQITQLLKEHVDAIIEIIDGVTQGMIIPEFINEQPLSPRLSHTIKKLYHNADQIADAFEGLRLRRRSTGFVSQILDLIRKRRDGTTFHPMMRQHLQLTLEVLKAHFRRDASDLEVFEKVRRGGHQIADQLTERLPWW